MAKQDDWVRITVRLPGALHERLASAVAEGPNSMNAEIISRLESSFEGPSGNNRYVVEAMDRAGVMTAYDTIRELVRYLDIKMSDLPRHLRSNISSVAIFRHSIAHGIDHAKLIAEERGELD